jgi:very-short-patch-repair endonuclease
MHEDLKICKICGFEAKSNNIMTIHLKLKHDLTLYDYLIQYFDIPICQYCNENKVEIYTRPLGASHRNGGRFWKLTCSNAECKSKYNIDVQKKYYENNEEAREVHRQHRIEYLKQRTGKTAWERRAAGEMSYLEQWFYDEVVIKHNLTEKYDIVNELSVYPYFIDFAFQNIKVAVELDGKCHFIHGETRNGHDRKKDELLISQGWKVFRIGYIENNEETINEFLTYISKIEAGEKELPNRMFKYSEVKELKKPKRTWEEWLLQKRNLNLELNKPLIDLVKNSDIDFSTYGWVEQVAILIDKKPQTINRWMKKYMLEFYETKCFKRK